LFVVYDGVAAFGVTGGGLKGRLVGAAYQTVTWLARMASLGRWRADASDVLIVAALPRAV
jgi:hypothetical protein